MPSVEPDRVTARTEHPHHTLFGLGCVVLLGVGVALALALPEVPAEPEAPAFSAADCEPVGEVPIVTRACLDLLPDELAQLPTPASYRAGRLADLIDALGLDEGAEDDASVLLVSTVFLKLPMPMSEYSQRVDNLVTRPAASHVRRALIQIDPLAAHLAGNALVERVGGRFGLPTLPNPAGDEVLRQIGAERDWSQPNLAKIAEAPTTDWEIIETEDQARTVARAARTRAVLMAMFPALQTLSERYGEERLAAYRAVWGGLEAEQQAAFEAASGEWRSARDTRSILWTGTLACLLLGPLLGVGWARSRPGEVTVTLHAVQLGHRVVPWEFVEQVDWREGELAVVVGGVRVGLGPRRVSEESRLALDAAIERALVRRHTLDPLDERALEEARRFLV